VIVKQAENKRYTGAETAKTTYYGGYGYPMTARFSLAAARGFATTVHTFNIRVNGHAACCDYTV
jgi:hypothetical protein